MRSLALFFLVAATALAQGGIAGTASRAVSITPDEGDFSVSATTTLDTTLAQVIQVFQNAGIRNLTAIELGAASNRSAPPATGYASYQVTFTVQPPALATFTRTLDTMKANPPAGFQSIQYSASLAASAAAVESARQAALPQLVLDARSKAQALATVAGLKLGRIQSITDATRFSYVLAPSFRSGDFSALLGYFNNSNGSNQQTFTVLVTFSASAQ